MDTPNGYLTYTVNKKEHRHNLWIMTLDQPQELAGSTSQSRLTRHFYPRSHAPGNLTVTGNCESQRDYQALARFIRGHHHVLMSQPASETYSNVTTNNAGYNRLLKLVVPLEGLIIRGFVPNFTIQKRGLFDPAPTYTLPFMVVIDQQTTSIYLSEQITKYYDGGVDRPNVTGAHPALSSPDGNVDLVALLKTQSPIPGTIFSP